MRYVAQDNFALRDKLTYGCGIFGASLAQGLFQTCIFVACMNTVRPDLSEFIYVCALSLLIECIPAMLSGLILDHFRHRHNAYKYSVLAGIVTVVAASLYLATLFPFSYKENLYPAAVCFVIGNIGFTIIINLYISLISRLSSSRKIRGINSASLTAACFVGRQMPVFAMIFITLETELFVGPSHNSFQYLLLLLTLLLLLITQPLFLFRLKLKPELWLKISEGKTELSSADNSNCINDESYKPEKNTGNSADEIPLTQENMPDALTIMSAERRYRLLNNKNTASFMNTDSDCIVGAEEAERLYAKEAETRSNSLFSFLIGKGAGSHGYKTLINILFRNDQLFFILFIAMMQFYAFSLTLTFPITDFREFGIDQNTLYIIVLLTSGPAQLLGVAAYPLLADEDRRSMLFSVSGLLFLFCCIVQYLFIESKSTFGIFISVLMFMTSHFCIGINKTAVITMIADTVDYGEFKLSIRSDGVIAGYVFSIIKLSGVVTCSILSTERLSTLFEASISFIDDISRYVLTDMTMPMTAVIISLLMHRSFFKLNGAFYRNILNNLQFLRHSQICRNTSLSGEDTDSFMLRYSLDSETMLVKLKAKNQEDLLHAMVQKLVDVQAVSSEHDFMYDLLERLKLGPCGIAEGIAIPHAKSSSVIRATVVVATLDKPLDLGALDERKCDLIFMLASPNDGFTHLNLLGRLSLLLNEPGFADRLRGSRSSAELFEKLIQCEKNVVN